MSVYRPAGETYFAYDFQVGGRRFYGSTRATNRRDALKVEETRREEARALIRGEKQAADAPMTLDRAAGRYWAEVGQYHAAPDTTWKNLERLIAFLGKDKPIRTISDDDVAGLVAWRRQHTVRDRKFVTDPLDLKKKVPAPLVSNGTVNRSTTEVLQKILSRAQSLWGQELKSPDWKKHILREAAEIVREVKVTEEIILAEGVRDDYAAIVEFARCSGLRQAECLLRKAQVDLAGGHLTCIGKGGKKIRRSISNDMRAILMSEIANPTDYVFTYRAKRAKKGTGGYPKGAYRPITASGLKTEWRRAKRKGVPADLRFHDLRHDFATKLLRETGNLKLVQKALNHSKIETTSRYAHVLDEEVVAGMDAMGEAKRRRKSVG